MCYILFASQTHDIQMGRQPANSPQIYSTEEIMSLKKIMLLVVIFLTYSCNIYAFSTNSAVSKVQQNGPKAAAKTTPTKHTTPKVQVNIPKAAAKAAKYFSLSIQQVKVISNSDGSYYWQATIKNNGPAATPPRLYVKATQIGYGGASAGIIPKSLKRGQSATVKILWNRCYKVKTLKLTVLKRLNERQPIAEKSISLQPLKVKIDVFNWNPATKKWLLTISNKTSFYTPVKFKVVGHDYKTLVTLDKILAPYKTFSLTRKYNNYKDQGSIRAFLYYQSKKAVCSEEEVLIDSVIIPTTSSPYVVKISQMTIDGETTSSPYGFRWHTKLKNMGPGQVPAKEVTVQTYFIDAAGKRSPSGGGTVMQSVAAGGITGCTGEYQLCCEAKYLNVLVKNSKTGSILDARRYHLDLHKVAITQLKYLPSQKKYTVSIHNPLPFDLGVIVQCWKGSQAAGGTTIRLDHGKTTTFSAPAILKAGDHFKVEIQYSHPVKGACKKQKCILASKVIDIK